MVIREVSVFELFTLIIIISDVTSILLVNLIDYAIRRIKERVNNHGVCNNVRGDGFGHPDWISNGRKGKKSGQHKDA